MREEEKSKLKKKEQTNKRVVERGIIRYTEKEREAFF